MMRGFDEVAVISPNAGLPPPPKSVLGFANFGVFVKLKNSARNWSELDSVTGKFRWIPKSRLSWFGPRKIPTPQSPNPLPSPINGTVVNAAGLKYPFRRLVNDPEDAGFAPVHSAREKPERLPYIWPALESTAVSGSPDCKTDSPENFH